LLRLIHLYSYRGNGNHMTEINYFNFFALYSGDDLTAEVDNLHVERIR
jgi:hypothetical protein